MLTLTQRALFYKSLSKLLKARLPILQSLILMENLTKDSVLLNYIRAIKQNIEYGRSMQQACKKCQGLPAPDILLIGAGEESGRLDEVIRQLHQNDQKRLKTRQQILHILKYPAAVLILSVAISCTMLSIMLPSLHNLHATLGITPNDTFLLLAQIEKNKMWIFLICFCLFVFGWFTKDKWRCMLHNSRIRNSLFILPVFSHYATRMHDLQCMRILFMGYQSGMTIRDCFRLLEHLPHHQKDDIKRAAKTVERGHRLYTALQHHALFQETERAQIAIGEESGQLEKTFQEIAEAIQFELDNKLQNLPKLIEPWLMVLIGGSVGLLVYVLYAPILSVLQTF